MNKPIGGFFELELPLNNKEFHENAYRFNLARSGLVAYLLERKCRKIYLPAFCCNSLAFAATTNKISVQFYNIDHQFEVVNLPSLNHGEYFLYVNYFSLKSAYIESILERYGSKAIIDNSQAFFASPPRQGAAIYSVRKFFGVPDGAYLYTEIKLNEYTETPSASYSVKHLVNRIENGPQRSYESYRVSERILKDSGIRRMSRFTHRVLRSIDYESIAKKRRENFAFLHERLAWLNSKSIFRVISQQIQLDNFVPMVYPLLIPQGEKLRNYLINNEIFVATYWNDVLGHNTSSSLEKEIVKNLIPLPVDHRYSLSEMERIVNLISAGMKE